MTPLAGRTVLVTRAEGEGGGLTRALEALGATVVEAPLIAFEPPPDWSPVDRAVQRPGDYDAVLLTSATTVRCLARRMQETGIAPASWGAARLVAIGPATAAAARAAFGDRAAFGARVDEVAGEFRAEGLVEMLRAEGTLQGRRLLLPRAEVAREILPEALRELGAQVDVVVVYRTVRLPLPETVRARLLSGGIDAVTFASASAVESFAADRGGAPMPADVVVAALGPVTADAARARGLEPDVVPRRATAADLAEALARFWESGQTSR